MHREPWQFLLARRAEYPGLFHGRRVLECGARCQVPTTRTLFADCDYTGLDSAPGTGVDVVCLVHEYEPAAPFDVIVSAQMLEHDPYWRESVGRMIDMLAPGGALLLTYAGPGYPIHDRARSPQPGYYENRSAQDVLALLETGDFALVRWWDHAQDVFILALGASETIRETEWVQKPGKSMAT